MADARWKLAKFTPNEFKSQKVGDKCTAKPQVSKLNATAEWNSSEKRKLVRQNDYRILVPLLPP